jgi:predicted RNase H-like HicB family nuclease
MKAHRRIYDVFILQEEDGTFSASVPALPGCYSQGDTLDELRENVTEAIQAYLESVKKDKLPLYDATSAFISRVEV